MKKLFALVLALLTVFSLSVISFADFGDYAGGSDWGYDSGGWDSGGWDSGYDSWDSGYDDSWDYDYDSGYSGGNYYYSGGSSSSDDAGGFELIVTAIVVIIIVVAVLGGGAAKKSSGNRKVVINSQPPANLVNDLAGLKQRDPNFNESKFLADAANLYVRMQNAWTDKDLTPLQGEMAEELYAKSARQLQSYIKNGTTNHVDRISVLSTDIVGCTKDAKNDIVTVQIVARITDYVSNDKTGQILRGDPNKELFMTYRWTFIRTLGKLTETDEKVDFTHCPNCGAPVDLNQSAVCEYCGSVLQSGEYDWVVSDMKGISQRSN